MAPQPMRKSHTVSKSPGEVSKSPGEKPGVVGPTGADEKGAPDKGSGVDGGLPWRQSCGVCAQISGETGQDEHEDKIRTMGEVVKGVAVVFVCM